MKKLILFVLIGAGVWNMYPRQEVQVLTNADLELVGTPYLTVINSSAAAKSPATLGYQKAASAKYSCDGRQYCSQMNSCSEAKFFLQNCPNPKMDGDSDGVPCERQWCK
ncbi:MAG: hypothetical protein OFPII_33080 [Osedax symbiont Rs1]|nr:MAG: hypothetical protein OFPII_33080 [Osedax symbiont Rs1]